MMGLNVSVTIIQTDRAFSDSMAVAGETETVIATGVKASIQPHVLRNLPPPGDRAQASGIFYLREFRCFIATKSIPGLQPLDTWIIQKEATGEKYRVKGVVDEAGRSHHWLLRLENYEG